MRGIVKLIGQVSVIVAEPARFSRWLKWSRSGDDSLELEDVFRLALSAVEMTDTRIEPMDYEEKRRYHLLDYVKMLDVKFGRDEPLHSEFESYTSWSLRDNVNEYQSDLAVVGYVPEHFKIHEHIRRYMKDHVKSPDLLNLEARCKLLDDVCSGMSKMSGEDFGLFFQYCFYLTRNHDFVSVLSVFVRDNATANNSSSSEVEATLLKLDEWTKAQNFCDGKVCIVLTAPFTAKLCISSNISQQSPSSDVIDYSAVGRIVKHMCDRIGSFFPFREVELSKVNFSDCQFPLSEIRGDAMKFVTRITFNDCTFKDGIFALHPKDDKDIVENAVKVAFSHCGLKNISDPSRLLRDIEALQIYDFAFNDIPKATLHMKNLRILDIRNGSLIGIPPEIRKLEHLQVLILSDCKFGRMPTQKKVSDEKSEGVVTEDATESLKIMNNIFQLKMLEVLVLDRSGLCVEDKRNFRLKHLKYLSMRECNLSKFPSFVYLPFKDNWLASCVRSVFFCFKSNTTMCLPELEMLDVSSNKIENSSNYTLPSKCEIKIAKLLATNNNLTSIPDWIFNMKDHLGYLNLSYNKIRAIPSFIGDMRMLRVLNLNCNEIDCIPRRAIPVDALVILKLAKNPITSVPPNMWESKTLEALEISHDQLDPALDEVKSRFGTGVLRQQLYHRRSVYLRE